MPYTRCLLFVASSPAYWAFPGPACLPTSSAVSKADCSGEGPSVKMRPLLAVVIFYGTGSGADTAAAKADAIATAEHGERLLVGDGDRVGLGGRRVGAAAGA